MNDKQSAVYNALRDGKKHTDAKAREAAGLSDEEFDAEIQRLQRDFWVDVHDGKSPSYQLTDKGSEHLAALYPA